MKKRRFLSVPLYLIILVLLFSVITAIFGSRVDDLTYSQILELFHDGQVRSFTVEDDTIHLVLQDPFAMFPMEISSYIMPGLNIVLFFGVEMLVYLVFGRLSANRSATKRERGRWL